MKRRSFCASINCDGIMSGELGELNVCHSCMAYRYHQYLRDNGQILEAGSELVKAVAAAQERQLLINRRRELRRDNDVTKNELLPGLAELIEAIHQADMVLEQALAGLEE